MSTPTDPAGPVLAFLSAIELRAKELPDPLGDDYTSPGKSSVRPQSMRIRGLIMQLAEEDRKITRAFEWDKGALTQELISRGLYNSTVLDSKLRELFQKAEADRSALREQWYSGLSIQDRVAFNDYCFIIAESVIQPHLPESLQAALNRPLARLALEHAAIGRRADEFRKECEKSLANRGLSRTAVESVLSRLKTDEEEAKSRLIGRWFREQEDRSEALAPRESNDLGGERDWLTVSEAARASGANPGEISRAATSGALKSNGEVGRKRRIDAASLTMWQLQRAKRGDVVESDAAVERMLNRPARE